MNIVDPILFQCRRQPPTAALCVPGSGLISYRRLEQHIHNVTRRLHGFGFPQRGIVAVSIDDAIFHVVVVLALTQLGMTTVSLTSELSLPIKIDALIADVALAPRLAQGGRVMLADASWTEGPGRPLEPHLLPQTREEDLCRLILTSGTSNQPKAVPLSHKLLANRLARHTTFTNRLANCSRVYCDMPLSSSLGFQFLLATLSRGGTTVFPGDSFAATLRVIEDYRVQCLVGSPGGFESLLRGFDGVPAYQSNVEVIVCAGDLLSRSLSERLRARICSHLIAIYGSTEASMSAVAYAHEIAQVPRAVGFVTPGVVVQIVDPSGVLLSPEQEGMVRVRSEFAVQSYLGSAEESNKVFRDGWFYPGDLGKLSADGLLVITGREQAVLNLGGDKVSPESIELVLSQFQGVFDAAAVPVANAYGNNEVCAVLVTDRGIAEPALRAYCDARLPRSFAPAKYLFVDKLPRNDNGKLDRRRLLDMIATLSG